MTTALYRVPPHHHHHRHHHHRHSHSLLYTDQPPVLHDCLELYGEPVITDGLSTYPIWDETKREWLNDQIIRHFRYRRIGSETAAQFAYYLNDTMHAIMRTLNPIFKALDDEIDILDQYHTYDKGTGSTNNTAETKATSGALQSTTPQTQLSQHENYATGLSKTETENTSNADGTSDTYAEHWGRSTDLALVLRNWMSGINNALYILYNGLEPLFMQVWEDDDL